MRWRCSSGQATLEHVAVVVLVAALLLAAVAVAGGHDVAGAVRTAMLRALCVVGGGACDADREPCVTGWRRDARPWGLQAGVVRLGGEEHVLVERLSDGSFRVTSADEREGGLEWAAGLGVKGVDAELRAALMAGAGHGGTWVLPDAAAVERWLARRRAWQRNELDADPSGPADVTFGERAPALRLGGAASGAGAGTAATGAVELARGDVRGVRTDRRTGRRTYYLEDRAVQRAGVRLGAGGRRAGGSAGASSAVEVAEQLAVTTDARGRPLELVVLRTDASGAVPPAAAGVASLPARGRGSRVVVTEQRLDLTDAGNLAAAAAAVRAVRAGRGGAAAARGLAGRLAEAAVVHVRAYDLDASRRDLGGTVRVGGVEVGGFRGEAVERARLVAAATRGLGGAWAARGDCAAA